ncbi:survival protein sure-likephosphatase/nucleotidase-like protein [Durotheca rogersii]|uniref:survival protein sure-likephosphatase/nucleotidase-like protein n=1 Tax=Durotheca rogersii TaxID=419775 RepID=UPI00221F356D|nr:survival protein sure-likephosphatase/nucleotidase-like protein [Durotheca rogersii]KAI5865503.1 survival protein sure-likephosphatase/nucleotidase-like protein [Durotheca rogersii]
MRTQSVLPLLSILGAARGARILQSNDDGWAELYVRSLHDALRGAGHDVVLSAPAENKSGSSSSDREPEPRTSPCQYDSCPANGGPVGSNATDPRLNWVNSFPVTAVKYGLSTFGPQVWGDEEGPDLVVTGPNVGSNVWLAVPFSGTVGAAVEAARNQRIPAIAFSGADSGTLRWDTSPVPARSAVYAELATILTNKVLDAGAPYLPDDVFLNVNFPRLTAQCAAAADFRWVLSRINPGIISAPDVETCGDDRLPTENEVINSDGCFASISVGDATDKTTAPAEKQAVVLRKLGNFLTCL